MLTQSLDTYFAASAVSILDSALSSKIKEPSFNALNTVQFYEVVNLTFICGVNAFTKTETLSLFASCYRKDSLKTVSIAYNVILDTFETISAVGIIFAAKE